MYGSSKGPKIPKESPVGPGDRMDKATPRSVGSGLSARMSTRMSDAADELIAKGAEKDTKSTIDISESKISTKISSKTTGNSKEESKETSETTGKSSEVTEEALFEFLRKDQQLKVILLHFHHVKGRFVLKTSSVEVKMSNIRIHRH
jgi:hypothetical protein